MIEVREVLRAIGANETTRREIMARFKASGSSLDRWQIADQWAMADAITYTEDALELRVNGKWTPLRERLRAIRRRLEDDLNDRNAWPIPKPKGGASKRLKSEAVAREPANRGLHG